VALDDVALYQTLKVPLTERGIPVANRPIDVVQGKAALVRAFLSPVAGDAGATEVTVHGRLTITSATGGKQTVEDTRVISAASSDDDLGSTLGFSVDGALLRADSTVSVDLLEPASCRNKPEQARLPRQGAIALQARQTGVLKVVLVPVRYDADGSGRVPDTSAVQLDRLRAAMLALYPVARVDISVREVVGSSIDLAGSSSGGWSQFLDSLRGLRASDKAADDTYYYGLVQPAVTLGTYCQRSCIAGISFQVTEDRPSLRVGVGLAYPGETESLTLAHEVGHQHGRGHAPCGATVGLDAAYPYPSGATSTWGFDARSSTLIQPTRKDMMSYCDPQWISDYNYQALLERSATVNPLLASEKNAPQARDWDVLLVGADGVARRGQPLAGFAPPVDSVRESADLLDGAGGTMGSVEVVKMPLADVDVTMVLVPRMASGVKAIKLRSMAQGLRLDLMPGPGRLTF
jgi:hypothetical protein